MKKDGDLVLTNVTLAHTVLYICENSKRRVLAKNIIQVIIQGKIICHPSFLNDTQFSCFIKDKFFFSKLSNELFLTVKINCVDNN